MASARLARYGGRGVVGALVLAAAVAAGPAAHAAGGVPSGGGGGPACARAAGPFRVSGTRVLDGAGKPFVSYGLTVPGLQGTGWERYVSLDMAKIAAAADDWCANTVRLQVDQDDLVGPQGTSLDVPYLAAIKDEVSLAESYGLVVVLNDETNYAPLTDRDAERGPTPATEAFWKAMAKAYGHDRQVIFDLFNEPRMYSAGMSQAQEWQLWLDGGTFDGVSYPFGMAELASYVRTTLQARNLFWIEGPDFSASFGGMVAAGALLHVTGVVYAVHHPAGQPDAASWDTDFGYLVADGIAPAVEGEWTNYEPEPTAGPVAAPTSCWPDAPTAVPAFLKYLAGYGIGLNAYQLQPGLLIRSYTSLAGPTTINAKTWTCQSDAETQPGQGAGSEVLAWFQQQNG